MDNVMVETVNAMVREVYDLAERKGWHENIPEEHGPERVNAIAAKLLMIVSEIAEATEALRLVTPPTYKPGEKPEGVPPELADVVIRVFDLAGILRINLGEAIREKHNYNQSRSYRHGGKRL